MSHHSYRFQFADFSIVYRFFNFFNFQFFFANNYLSIIFRHGSRLKGRFKVLFFVYICCKNLQVNRFAGHFILYSFKSCSVICKFNHFNKIFVPIHKFFVSSKNKVTQIQIHLRIRRIKINDGGCPKCYLSLYYDEISSQGIIWEQRQRAIS